MRSDNLLEDVVFLIKSIKLLILIFNEKNRKRKFFVSNSKFHHLVLTKNFIDSSQEIKKEKEEQ